MEKGRLSINKHGWSLYRLSHLVKVPLLLIEGRAGSIGPLHVEHEVLNLILEPLLGPSRKHWRSPLLRVPQLPADAGPAFPEKLVSVNDQSRVRVTAMNVIKLLTSIFFPKTFCSFAHELLQFSKIPSLHLFASSAILFSCESFILEIFNNV